MTYEDLSECVGTAPELSNCTVLEEWSRLPPTKLFMTGFLVFLCTIHFILFLYRWFPIGSATSTVCGCFSMVIGRVLTQADVYEIVGRREHVGCIAIMAGVLLLAQYVERERIFVRLFRRSLDSRQSFPGYAMRVFVVTTLSSAVFTGDATCLLLTPIILRMWKHHERPAEELECLLFGIAVSANLGSALSVFGSPSIALIAMKSTQLPLSSFGLLQFWTYLGIPVLIAFMLNYCFVILLHRIRIRHIGKSKLISEESHSEQELAGLTSRHLPKLNGLRGHSNSAMGDQDSFQYDGLQPDSNGTSDSRTSVPCQLETIHEDEVLEITSSTRTISFREDDLIMSDDSAGSSSDSDTDDRDTSRPDTTLTRSSPLSEQLNRLDDTMDVTYTPNGLQSSASIRQTDSEPVLNRDHLAQQGLKIKTSDYVYRSFTGISPVMFIVVSDTDSSDRDVSDDVTYKSSDSRSFHAMLLFSILLMMVLSLITSSWEHVYLDIGLLPVVVALLVVMSDVFLNCQPAHNILHRVNWIALIQIIPLFIFISGAAKTRMFPALLNQMNVSLYSMTSTTSFQVAMNPASIAILAVTVLLGVNVIGALPMTILLMDLMLPHSVNGHATGLEGGQLMLIALFAWLVSVSVCCTAFGSAGNVLVLHSAQQVLAHRFTYKRFLICGVLFAVLTLTLTVPVIVGLLHIQT